MWNRLRRDEIQVEEKAIREREGERERRSGWTWRRGCEQDVEEGISGDAEKWMGTDWPCKAE